MHEAESHEILRRAILGDSQPQPSLRFDFAEAQFLLKESLMLDVSPAEIGSQLPYNVDVNGEALKIIDYFIADGDLSAWKSDIDQSRVMAETRELIEADMDFRQTGHYQRRARALAAGKVRRLQHSDHDSIEKLDRYFENSVRMLRLAQRFGILKRPAPAVDGANGHFAPVEVRDFWLEMSESNVGVAIDADGSLLRAGPGKHRMVAAKLLGLTSIPCELRLIHATFLKPFLQRENGDAVSAVGLCARYVKERQAALIAEAETAVARAAERRLEALAADGNAVQPRFVFQRSQLPLETSSALLCLVPAGAIQRLLVPPRRRQIEATLRVFIGRGSWRNITAPLDGPLIDPLLAKADETTLEVWRKCAQSAGQALVLRADAVPLAISAEGELLLWGRADSRLDLARAQRIGHVFAEICLVHLDWLRNSMARRQCGPLAALERGLAELNITRFNAPKANPNLTGHAT